MNKPFNPQTLEVGYDVPALPGMDETDIQTPCLVLDLDALEPIEYQPMSARRKLIQQWTFHGR